MQREAKKYLYDIEQAANLIAQFTANKAFADYQRDSMLRLPWNASLALLAKHSRNSQHNPTLAARVSEHRRIIAFRNILVHGYVDVDDRLVWDVIESKLARLQEEIASLLRAK